MNAEKEKTAIERLKAFEPQSEPYYLCYSGGKDSDCIRILASLAGVKHDIVNNHTTVDAPETVRYIRSIPGVQISYPDTTMWKLIVKMGVPPTRLMRYCCAHFKEQGGKGRLKVTGVRWDESVSRKLNGGVVKILGNDQAIQSAADEIGADYETTKKGGLVMNADNDKNRRLVEHCYRTQAAMVNPIIDWTEADVWQFLHHYGCESNPLYQCGFKRVGCIGCPMASAHGMRREFTRYPKYKENYVRAFDRMLDAREARGLKRIWETGEHVMHWWLEEDPDQLTMDI